MSKIFYKSAYYIISALFITLLSETESGAISIPTAQNWDSISPWSQVYYGSALDYSQSAPGSPSTSLRFTFPAGMKDGNAPDTVWVNFFQVQELYVQYYFKYSSNWTRHPVNDKQAYFQLGGGGVGNFFLGVGKWGNSSIFMEYQPHSGKSGSRFPNTGYNPIMKNNVWYKLTMHAVLNAPGVANGIIQIWIDDQLVINCNNIHYRESDQGVVGISSVDFTPVWGGMANVTKPETEYFWVDSTSIRTVPTGLNIPPSSINQGKAPSSPSSLLIHYPNYLRCPYYRFASAEYEQFNFSLIISHE